LHEIKYLPKEEGYIDIAVLAGFLRDFIEGFSR